MTSNGPHDHNTQLFFVASSAVVRLRYERHSYSQIYFGMNNIRISEGGGEKHLQIS